MKSQAKGQRLHAFGATAPNAWPPEAACRARRDRHAECFISEQKSRLPAKKGQDSRLDIAIRNDYALYFESA
jgi:hypothetical protein